MSGFSPQSESSALLRVETPLTVQADQIVELKAALLRSESWARALFEHSHLDMLVMSVGADGGVFVEEFNAAFSRTTGVENAAGQPVELALGKAAGATVAANCRACLAQGGYECQQTLWFPAGERRLRMYYRTLPPDRSSPSSQRVLLKQIDVTDSHRVELALRQAMRLEAIGQLTGGVAHEFNNLLTAILGSLELLARKLPEPQQARWVQNATNAAQRGAVLTGQLLAYARKQFMTPAITDVPATLGANMELIRGSLGGRITLAAEFAPSTWPALTDPAQLELALLNLVVNARDAMPGGGRVTLATSNVPAADSALPSELNYGDYVLLTVADTGVGMTPEVLARAMEPFFTTKKFGEGSGLGLSQAYGVARQLGGTIRLRSVPGEGTCAEIFLPRAASALQAAVQLLLVDDDNDVRAVAAAMLREEGWQVQEADSGEAALVALAQQPFAVLLADLAMPGLSGEALVTAVRIHQPNLPVIFLTSDARAAADQKLFGRVLAKPYTAEALRNAVTQAMSNWR